MHASESLRSVVDLQQLSPTVTPLAVTSAQPLPRGRRSRLSRDLHDGVGQSLNLLLIEIRVAIDRGYAQRDDLLILEGEAEKAIQSVRTLAYQVRRRSRLDDPLGDARRYAERILGPGADLRWVDERRNLRLAPKVARELAWSIRESITNAMHHGRASTVEVRLTEAEGRIRATIRDDGVGFEPELVQATPEGRGLGLLGNAERMASIGGIVTIRSRPGEGTVVALEAPRFLRRRNPALQSAQLVLEPRSLPLVEVVAV